MGCNVSKNVAASTLRCSEEPTAGNTTAYPGAVLPSGSGLATGSGHQRRSTGEGDRKTPTDNNRLNEETPRKKKLSQSSHKQKNSRSELMVELEESVRGIRGTDDVNTGSVGGSPISANHVSHRRTEAVENSSDFDSVRPQSSRRDEKETMQNVDSNRSRVSGLSRRKMSSVSLHDGKSRSNLTSDELRATRCRQPVSNGGRDGCTTASCSSPDWLQTVGETTRQCYYVESVHPVLFEKSKSVDVLLLNDTRPGIDTDTGMAKNSGRKTRRAKLGKVFNVTF